MNLIETIRQPIATELKLLETTFAEALKSDNELLASVNEYILQGNGKKLRPMIVLLTAKLFGDIQMAAIHGSLALELLHTASLVHDDVVDDTMERRNRPSVNARWNNKVAVLSGDYMLSNALNQAVKTRNVDILAVIANIGMQLSDGELLQLVATNQTEVTEEAYLKIIQKKTALLFAACAEVGALSMNADSENLNHLSKFGEYLGYCFQIKDDIFDYYDDIQIGKPTGNDLQDGKLTLPLIYALRNTVGAEKDEVIKWINGQDFSVDNIQTINRFAHNSGGVAYAESRMEDFKNKAIAELDSFEDSEVKIALLKCAEFAATRVS